MADIRTITILPSQPIANVPQVQAAGAGTQGTTSLTGIASGTILNGFIVNRDAAGNPILRTDDNGDITFSSNFFLNIGSVVEIRIENNTTGTLAHLLTVNGQPPEVAAEQSAFAQEPEIIVSQNLSTPNAQAQATTSQPAANPPTLTVSGTLVSQPQSPAATTLPTGTQLTLKITGLTSAPSTVPDEILNSSPTPAQTPTYSQPANPASYATYARAAGNPSPAVPQTTVPAAPSAPAATANAQLQVPAQTVTTPEPATADPSPTPALPSGTSVTATVVNNESSHETALQTPVGLIRLQPGITLPAASQVTFEITETTLPEQAANAAISTNPAPLTELAQQWTSLQQIVNLLATRDPAAASNFIQDTLPWVMPPPVPTAQVTVPQNIPAGLMLFMAALRGGNFNNWLGQENVQWLQGQGHDALLKKADGEFMLMARQFTEAQPAHWQPLFFPVAVGSELHQARLFVKRDRRQGNNNQQEKKSDDTRFVIEVDLTQLGELQMDGFVRRQEKDVQFDLIIRSLTPLSKNIQNDILHIYNNTGQLAGYKGSLAFQTVREFPVNPMEEIIKRSGTVMA